MLSAQQTRERVLNAIKNNPKGVIRALGSTHPKLTELVARQKERELPRTLFRVPEELKNVSMSTSALQIGKIAHSLAKKKDEVLLAAITTALGTSKIDIAEMLPRLSVGRTEKYEMVYLDDKELIKFFNPEPVHASSESLNLAWTQGFIFLYAQEK